MNRCFLPGSEWIYYKVYLPINLSDSFISYFSKDCCIKLITENVIDKWFFIKYYDPFFHLRIRLHLKSPQKDFTYIFQKVNETIKNSLYNEYIWRICIDSYIQELERYGIRYIENCENYFYHDSFNTALIFSCIEDCDNEIRWKLAFAKIDLLMTRIIPNLKDRHNFIKNISDSFLKEFNHFDNHYDLDKMYRDRKVLIDVMTEDLKSKYILINDWFLFLNSHDFSWVLSDLQGYSRLQSIIHMTVNRIVSTEPRKYELILYFFLERKYNRLLHKQ